MNKFSFAVAAAVLVVAVGGALLLTRPGSNNGSGVGTTPDVSPSPTTSSSPPAAGSVPAELQARWMGGPNDFVDAGAGSSIYFGRDTLELSQSNEGNTQRLTTQTSISNAGLLHLESSGPGPCVAGAGGDYDWSLSPSGRVLRLSPIEDPCTQRSAALDGTWWKMGCTTPDDNCLGLLDAGTYSSQFIAPHVDRGGTWAPVFGGLTYTVPDGWANGSDWPESFEIVPATDLPPIDDADKTGTISVLTQPTAMTQDPPCSDQVEPGVGRTAADLTTWIGTVPGLDTTEPTPITIDGRSGQALDISLDPSWTGLCNPGDPDTTPIVTYLNPGIGIRGVEHARLILLDLGEGDVVAIAVGTPDQAAFDAFIPEAMPVIESLQFE